MQTMVTKDFAGLKEIIHSGLDCQLEVQNALTLLLEKQVELAKLRERELIAASDLREQELMKANLRLESNLEDHTFAEFAWTNQKINFFALAIMSAAVLYV